MSDTGLNNVNLGANLLLIALGSSAMSAVPLELFTNDVPTAIAEYHNLEENPWGNSYQSASQDIQDLNKIVEFSEKLVGTTRDIESDILEVVNRNYWNLL